LILKIVEYYYKKLYKIHNYISWLEIIYIYLHILKDNNYWILENKTEKLLTFFYNFYLNGSRIYIYIEYFIIQKLYNLNLTETKHCLII
jgi:hypothetical protein